MYKRNKRCFLLGKHYLKLTVNEVSMILGLPNRGRKFCFTRLPCIEHSHRDLLNEMRNLVNEEWSEDLERRRVNILIKYLVIIFLFPLKTLKIPKCLAVLEDGVVALKEYNWPKAIHAFLHVQLDSLSRANTDREDDTCLGYFEGCSIVLLLSHITLSGVQAVDLIVMPCHMSAHWTLLICRLKERCWEFYDSLRSSRHRATLPKLVHSHNHMKVEVQILMIIYISCRSSVYTRMLVIHCQPIL
ncbi:hypothetical protein KSP39_PZI003718 [Platanthera zijinensis]|uniref:Ubiquitin-like protease family profile domain-containing protein n=1 Tax=Platanthera zijinensis TaxID=2320716 RepID=A0AAP0GDE3_9ASPA